MLKDKTILLGVTGGIAGYKSADIVSRLVKQRANVEVIMTSAATEFVNPLTFQTMSNHPVHIGQFNEIDRFDVEHIALAKKADLILVAPATANTIGKIANGIADNLLTTVIMATKSRVAFAPAMNTQMYKNIIYQENMDKLKKLGYEFIEPGVGRLACGDSGPGKMAEPEDIVDYIISSFVEKDLIGKKIVITAGPTIEPIDPVRFLSNHSSGRMGYDIARNARDRGADVVLISGPSSLEAPKGIEVINIKTTNDMFNAVESEFDNCDVLIKAAAPADFRPAKASDIKIKKTAKEDMSIDMVKNPDIAEYFGNKKDKQIVVGFAAETNNLSEYAKGKLIRKNFDFIVANDITKKGAGFKTDTNIVTIIDPEGRSKEYPLMRKNDIANILLDRVLELL